MVALSVKKKLQESNDLIQNRRFDDALSILSCISSNGLPDSLKAYHNMLYTEANLWIGNYKVLPNIKRAIEYYRTSIENDNYAHAKYLHGWLLVALGDWINAKEVLLESYITYKRYNNLQGQMRTLNRLSYVAYHVGDVDSAIAYIKECIKGCHDTNDEATANRLYTNLAQLYFALGRLNDSIKEHKVRSSDFGPLHYIMSSIPLALKGSIAESRKIIDLALCDIEGFSREKAIYYENLGWIHLLEEDYQSAEKALLKGLKISLKIAPKSALISQIKRRLADACLGLKRANEAKQYCDEAMEVAKHINERVEIAACWRVYAQLDVINGNEPKARQWFTKAIDMFAMISSRYELAATRYLAATSGVYQNGERQALLYMAREYFESEDVAHYIEKIDKELKRTQISPKPRRAKSLKKIPTIIAGNVRMKKLVDLAEHVAPSDMNVLLTGETGTGKDLLAKFIHYHSGREGRFMSVNAAAIPDQMIESELFGYKKGAYTGADRATSGLIEEAEGGTFYLNEVADASSELQAKLLDVIETRKVRRLGERESNKIDFRIIAATNHDIEQLIRDGKFRADLYHRLREIPITLPPLSDRIDDMEPLLRHFLSSTKLNGDSSDNDMTRLAEVLSSRIWPGNVRQLEAEVKRLALTSDGDIKQIIITAMTSAPSEAEQLQALLEETGWNKAKAARILGVSEGTIRHRIKKLGITLPVS